MPRSQEQWCEPQSEEERQRRERRSEGALSLVLAIIFILMYCLIGANLSFALKTYIFLVLGLGVGLCISIGRHNIKNRENYGNADAKPGGAILSYARTLAWVIVLIVAAIKLSTS